MNFVYDVIVVGAGHAGSEAARAAARMGSKTLLITMDLGKIAQMSCNPAVGGIAKGQIVREIDALGGYMGVATDRSSLQFRMLNRSKGAAMWSPRSQSDRDRFSSLWKEELQQTSHLSMWMDHVTALLVRGDEVVGVHTALGVEFESRSVVLTNGTFLNGLMHLGTSQFVGGRLSEPASSGLTEQLRDLGFVSDRMKTGTPMRLDARTIHFDLCEQQDGDQVWNKFSFLDTHTNHELQQRPCYITYTNQKVHDLLASHLHEAPLYNGQINSIGPRYCPSIETKITTFSEKDHHQLFLEPEGERTTEFYINGFSSSMPLHVQEKAIRLIPALQDAHILRPGYAIEYDFFDPTQLYHTLETKQVRRLFFAGQINGTTGYEEAAGQGLIAGINAHYAAQGTGESFTISRDSGYIGVLIDDLVTKGVDEPYRMFTSRAEYRILLRQDNADERLTERGYGIGLVDEHRMNRYRQKKQLKEDLVKLISKTSVRDLGTANAILESVGSAPLKQSVKARDILSRPNIGINDISCFVPEIRTFFDSQTITPDFALEILESAEVEIKYDGYIRRENEQASKARRLEGIRIAGHLDYSSISSLSIEARQKLQRIQPTTIGQASRIPGVSPADINILLVLLGR